MKEHVSSGCGPGISRPADTPQQGVRSVRVRYDETSALLELGRIVGDIDALLWADTQDWPTVARLFQKGADVAGNVRATALDGAREAGNG